MYGYHHQFFVGLFVFVIVVVFITVVVRIPTLNPSLPRPQLIREHRRLRLRRALHIAIACSDLVLLVRGACSFLFFALGVGVVGVVVVVGLLDGVGVRLRGRVWVGVGI